MAHQKTKRTHTAPNNLTMNADQWGLDVRTPATWDAPKEVTQCEGSDDGIEISIRILWQEEFMNGGPKEKKYFGLA